MSDLLLVNGEARQLVANPHYSILLTLDEEFSEGSSKLHSTCPEEIFEEKVIFFVKK